MRSSCLTMSITALLGFAVPATVTAQPSPNRAAPAVLRLVSQHSLNGEGLSGDVTIVGTTAVVAAGMMAAAGVHAHLDNPYPCPAVNVKLVDLSNPERPLIVGTIPVPAGIAAHGVSAARVRTVAFTGDLLAVALTMCSAEGSTQDRGVAYYDITRPAEPRLLGRYMADNDIVHPDSVPACGPPPSLSPLRCASSQHSVSLVQRSDGRVLSLSVEPGASASNYPSGDLRVVDVTDPRNPKQIFSHPPAGTPIFSNNGCRPFSAAHGAGTSHDGTRGLLAFYDGGLFVLDLANPAAPRQLGQFTYPDQRGLEGSAAYVAPARVNGRDLAVISEADFMAPTTTLHIHAPSPLAGPKFACEAVFTLYDPADKAQLYRQPNAEVSGELSYVGRGCPVSHSMDMMHADDAALEADPYLSDVRGRIVLMDRSKQPIQADIRDGPGCTVAERTTFVQARGARALILLQTSATASQAFSPDGDPTGVSIPVVMIDKGDADALRSALCPSLANGRCVATPPMSATLSDTRGEWGAVRIVDVTNAALPREVGEFRPPEAAIFPPRDLGVYSPQRAAIHGQFAAVPWNSGGVRVLDLSNDSPSEVAYYVPPDVADPTRVLPSKAYVMSIGLLTVTGTSGAPARDYIVMVDLNSGLYVLEAPWQTGH